MEESRWQRDRLATWPRLALSGWNQNKCRRDLETVGTMVPGILSVHDLCTLQQLSTEITFILLINDSTNVGEIFIKCPL